MAPEGFIQTFINKFETHKRKGWRNGQTGFIFTYNWGTDEGCHALQQGHIGVIDNGDKDNDFIDINNNDTFDGDADGDLDGDLEKEEKAKCIGEGVSTK